jgi:RHS repeat-associated protein
MRDARLTLRSHLGRMFGTTRRTWRAVGGVSCARLTSRQPKRCLHGPMAGVGEATTFAWLCPVQRSLTASLDHTMGLSKACVGILAVLLLNSHVAGAQEQVEYYGIDAIGSVRIVFDAAGALNARTDFSVFGEKVTAAPGSGAALFAQLAEDNETGLDAADARMYQVRTGRFSRVDPVYNGLLEPQRWNRYAYGLNNPLTYTDSAGLNANPCEYDACVTAPFVDANMWWFFSGFGGFGGGSGSGSGNDGSSGYQGRGGNPRGPAPSATPPKGAPLPPTEDAAATQALSNLQNYQPTPKCEAQVVSRLPNFSYESFQQYLGLGAHFYDGTTSTNAAATLFPNAPAARLTLKQSLGSTVAQWFGAAPGMNAFTATGEAQMTVYFRPSALGGSPLRNRSLMFHEGLHAFGQGTSLFDQDLEAAFKIPKGTPSVAITNYISKNCQ